ncbi:MAG TPA: hypothetical protein VFT69_17350 [Pseudolabrys sp.]|nr:hypothetical protein [Pseudolabrys sp.]
MNGVAKAIEQMPSYIKAAADGLSSLESWLAKVGNNPIWDRINKFLGIDGAAKAREFSEAVNKPVASTTTTATAPAAKPEIKPVSLADFTLPGKKTGKSAADTRHSQVESYIQQLEKSGRVLQAEYDTLGKSNSERAKAIELARIGTVTDAGQVKRIEAAVDANEQLRQKIEQVTRAQEGLRDAAQYAGEAITDSLADVLIDGKDASDVIDNLARQLARAALQSALIGSGPLSGLFGTRNASGGLGGLFGALLGGFAFADGGIMTARGPLPLKRYDRGGIANSPQLALYGEGKDPEAYVPLPDGRTIPVSITAPSIAPAATVNNAPTIVNAPQISINVEGGSRGPEADQELAQKIGQHVEASLQHTITREIHRQMRPGGIIAAGRR